MKIILVRHAESTGNRDRLWAGVTDSHLTLHGVEQAKRLADYMSKIYGRPSSKNVASIYCSDLSRAATTASIVAEGLHTECHRSHFLREQDLGWKEGMTFNDPRLKLSNELSSMNPGESKAQMDVRAQTFIRQVLQPFLDASDLHTSDSGTVLVIVSHGLFLLRLYYTLCKHLHIASPPVPRWYNTGCTTITLLKTGSAAVTDINSVEHLKNLRRTRYIGNAPYDPDQRKVSDFFRHGSSVK